MGLGTIIFIIIAVMTVSGLVYSFLSENDILIGIFLGACVVVLFVGMVIGFSAIETAEKEAQAVVYNIIIEDSNGEIVAKKTGTRPRVKDNTISYIDSNGDNVYLVIPDGASAKISEEE